MQMRSVMNDDVGPLRQRVVSLRRKAEVGLRKITNERPHTIGVEIVVKVPRKICLQTAPRLAVLCPHQTVDGCAGTLGQFMQEMGAEEACRARQQYGVGFAAMRCRCEWLNIRIKLGVSH